jgi:hypothetical protein
VKRASQSLRPLARVQPSSKSDRRADRMPRRSQKSDEANAAVRRVLNTHDPEGLIEMGRHRTSTTLK